MAKLLFFFIVCQIAHMGFTKHVPESMDDPLDDYDYINQYESNYDEMTQAEKRAFHKGFMSAKSRNDEDYEKVTEKVSDSPHASTHETRICEGHSHSISCGSKRIHVMESFYGREAGVDVCGRTEPNKCEMYCSDRKIEHECDDKTSCELHANNDEFGDPCAFIRKYIYIKYECI